MIIYELMRQATMLGSDEERVAWWNELTEEQRNTFLHDASRVAEDVIFANKEQIGCTNKADWALFDYMGDGEPDDVSFACHEHLLDMISEDTYNILSTESDGSDWRRCGFLHKKTDTIRGWSVSVL